MLITRFFHSGLLPAFVGRVLLVTATTTATSDACSKIAGRDFVDPADVMACQKSFPFNETIRQNVLSVVSGVLDFYTFEDYYLKSPPPFQDSTTDIRAEIARINKTHYATDYDFNLDVYNSTNKLNDGHTRWLPNCHISYQNVLPTPISILDDCIHIIPDIVELFDQLGSNFSDFFSEKNFDWQRLAGARVLYIEGQPAFDYIDEIARNVSGYFLDQNIRVNSVVSSYRLVNGTFARRLGDFAGRNTVTQTSVELSLIPVNSTTLEVVRVPFVATLVGTPFTDGRSYWENNCAANNQTNGVDRRSGSSGAAQSQTYLAPGALVDFQRTILIPLSKQYLPTLPPANGSTGVMKSYIMPGNKTGVLFVGSFGSAIEDFHPFLRDVKAAITQFLASGVTNIVIDVTGNLGGFVDLGYFLYQSFTGLEGGFPGFQSATRANPLAQKILKAVIQQGINSSIYAPENFQFLNGTQMPDNHNYNDPSVHTVINGRSQPTSQRFEDTWSFDKGTFPEKPPFDLDKIVIISAGCGSTCALFSTAMFERHHTKIAIFGGNLSHGIQYKGTAGNQIMEFSDLDSEIKTAGLKDDILSPPDLLVSATMSHNWRTAYSYLDETKPIAYVDEQPQYRFAYTAEMYKPENVWFFVEKQFFG